MTPDEMDGILAATLEDNRLSRGEKHALRELLSHADIRPDDHPLFQHRAFALAREKIDGQEAKQVLDWLEGVVKVLHAPDVSDDDLTHEVHFSPGHEPLRAIIRRLEQARERVDICVFTITDNRLATAILEAHKRDIHVRIVTDDDKSHDRGSDVHRLANEGIEVRFDQTDHHMHHKFAIFDQKTVITGSYNWTRSAAEHNQENILVTDDPRLVAPYRKMFDRFWDQIAPRSR
ncbi:MAG: phospholipase D-like domain-containing protein [Sandaracinaceae bacterium]